jgi:hypothetical protein
MRPIIRRSFAQRGWWAWSSGGRGRAVRRLAARSSGTAAGSGGLAAVLVFPVGRIGGPTAGFSAAQRPVPAGWGAAPALPVEKIGPGPVAGSGGPPGVEAAKRAGLKRAERAGIERFRC